MVVGLEQGVEQVADEKDAGGDHPDEDCDEPGFEDFAQDDQFGQLQADHRHHEGEHGAERRALAE